MQYDDLPQWLQEKVEEHCHLNIHCPEGWRDLCIGTLLWIRSLDPGFTLAGIKEKFGMLDIWVHMSWMDYDKSYDDYIDSLSDDQREKNQQIWDLLDRAHVKSCNMCDECGTSPAERITWNGWWIRALCEKHGAAVAEEARKMEMEKGQVH